MYRWPTQVSASSLPGIELPWTAASARSWAAAGRALRRGPACHPRLTWGTGGATETRSRRWGLTLLASHRCWVNLHEVNHHMMIQAGCVCSTAPAMSTRPGRHLADNTVFSTQTACTSAASIRDLSPTSTYATLSHCAGRSGSMRRQESSHHKASRHSLSDPVGVISSTCVRGSLRDLALLLAWCGNPGGC
jgi:hypothetical protein